MKNWDMQHRIGMAFAAAAMVLIGVFLLLDQSVRTQVERRNWVLHTEEVLRQLDSLRQGMTETNAAERAYRMTGDAAYLQPYRLTVRKIEPALESLSRLVADNPGQLQWLARLREAVRADVQSDQMDIEARQRSGVAAATRPLQETVSPQETYRIQSMIQQMGDEERRLLKQREERLQASDRSTAFASRASSFLVLALFCFTYTLFSRDAKKRQSLEAQLIRKNGELEEANRLKSEFLANMSHELRTPLNAVIGYTGTLLMKLPGPLTADQEKQLKTVQASAHHLLSLINDLLDLAKIESGKFNIKFEILSFQEIIEQVIATLRPIAQAKSLDLEAKLPSSALTAKTDRRAVSQILINLANNGIKFTEKGSVRLELSERAESGHSMAIIDVVDTGAGIRPEDQPQLFRAFEQLGAVGAREGTGLGLYVSGKLASLIGARIEFASVLGKGSRFTVVIPRA
jgi:signal transduction histidine kinase